jgi:hypothetical protein
VTTRGLDYWKASDAWKTVGDDVADWDAIDSYVDVGFLTSEERDLLHAFGSMVAASDENYPEKFPEMSAAWDHYQDLTQHQDTKDIKSPEFTEPLPDVNYYDKVAPGKWSGEVPPPNLADPPKVPGAHGEKGGAMAVNTEALMLFGTNMLQLKGMIDTSVGYVDLVNVKPGVFYDGIVLRDKVMGADQTPGLKYDTRDFMRNAAETLWDLNTEITKLVRDYDTVEELNGISTQKLEKIMAESYSDIDFSDQFSGEKSIGKNEDGDDVRST